MIGNWQRMILGLGLLAGSTSDAARADDPAATERAEAKARIARSDWTGAIEHLDRVLAIHPDDARALVERGHCHAERGDKGRARTDLDRAIALAPTLADAWLERGLLGVEGTDSAPALADLTEALRLDPGRDEARRARIGLLIERGDLDGARADCDTLIEQRTEESGIYEIRALIRLARLDGVGAAADLDEAIRRETLFDSSEILLFRALANLLAGRRDLARRDFDELTEQWPGDPMALALRGVLRLSEGQIPQARADAEAALEARPNEPNALTLGWLVASRQGRHADAIALVDRLIALQPDRPKHLNNRAELRREARDEAGALADYQKVQAWDPDKLAVADLADALAGQAWIAATSRNDPLRDGPRALHDAERACALVDPPSANALATRAAALAEVGRFEEAIRDAERAERDGRASPAPGIRTSLLGDTLTIAFDPGVLGPAAKSPREPAGDRPIEAYRQHRPYRARP